MRAPEQTDVEQRLEVAHVHDEADLPMTWRHAHDGNEDRGRDASSAVGWSFFECQDCGTRIAIRFPGGAADARWEG
jgi:hypothetical protein